MRRRGGIAQRMILASVALALVVAAAFAILLLTIVQARNAESSALHARIVVTADETRRRFGRDLHDGAQQLFVAAALRVRMARAAVPPDLPSSPMNSTGPPPI